MPVPPAPQASNAPQATKPAPSLLGPPLPREGAGVAGSYDEVRDSAGALRPHWRVLDQALGAIGAAEFERRWGQSQRLLLQNSLAFADLGAPHQRSRPWELDALPLMIGAEEWHSISVALDQRARLLNHVIGDLLGPQRLVRTGELPAELVGRHPGFRPPLVSQHPAGGRHLHFYAADLARSADGAWWVLADRTEAPSGSGFALENRMAISRMMPDVVRACQIERLAPYFVAVREQARMLDPQHRENPRVVLLSQEAGSANYFEDAYLCRYLGYTVAESGDLAVRNNHVYLKTLGGLSPVDVVLRRPNSDECDPLELPGSAATGVAGLVHASRTGSVAVANALGSGLVESPAVLAFMPRLCQAVLGEPLLMPGVATWWCGDPESCAYVLSRLEDLTIKPAFRTRGGERRAAQELARLSRQELADRIRARPYAFAAQERVQRSMAPVWDAGAPVGAYIALRAFAVASGADKYVVMQGGLARVSRTLDPLEVSLMQGERSKDTWVLAEGPVPQVTLLQSSDNTVALRRGGAELPSRVAENLYWLGRQAERAESLARLVRIVAQRLTSDEDSSRIPELPHLLRALAERGQIEPGFVVAEIRSQLPAIEVALPAAVFDAQQVGTLRNAVSVLAGLASTVRDRMSLECWRIIRQMDEQFWPGASTPDLADLLEKLDALMVSLSAFTGLVVESMTRTHAWRFLDLGRRLERASQTLSLIRAVLADTRGADHAPLEAMLEVADSLMTYRSRYLAQVRLGPVIDLLVTDETNPRAVAFQLAACADHVDRLPHDDNLPGYSPEQRLAMSLLHTVRMADSQSLARAHAAGDAERLEWLLVELDTTLPKLSDAVSHKYLIHAGPAHRLAAIEPS